MSCFLLNKSSFVQKSLSVLSYNVRRKKPRCSSSLLYSQQFHSGACLLQFKSQLDRFNGITVDLSKEKYNQIDFEANLEESLKAWSTEKRRCIWFKVQIGEATAVPILAKNGFNFHHANETHLMMYKWLPLDSKPNLPPSTHTNVGVGAMVFNNHNQLLAISETYIEYPHWKLPGGYVDKGEHIPDAAKREVKEETGVDCEFESLVTFRHTHNMMFGNSDLYILVAMKAISDKIDLCQREISQAKWMDIEEYTNHPLVNKWNSSIVKTYLEYKRKNLRLDLQRRIVQYGPYSRDITFLKVDS